jgi:hypothetical protein
MHIYTVPIIAEIINSFPKQLEKRKSSKEVMDPKFGTSLP